jgi:hypothetical protein
MPKLNPATTKSRISYLIAKLEAGADVQARDIKTVLTAAQWQQYQAEWSRQKGYRDEPKTHEISAYEKLLSKALMAYGRWDSYCQRKTAQASVKYALEQKHLAAFERAAEYLQECYQADAAIQVWFDRSLERDTYGIDPDSMPRVVTSRSLSNLSAGAVHVRTKRNIKLEALQQALSALNMPERDEALGRLVKERTARLQRMLKN